jgi:hypothetical protein
MERAVQRMRFIKDLIWYVTKCYHSVSVRQCFQNDTTVRPYAAMGSPVAYYLPPFFRETIT